MLKNNKRIYSINHSDERNCHMEVDTAALQACEDGWQAEADACQAQIDQYNALISEIEGKQAEAASLQSEFNSNASRLAEANIRNSAVDSVGACLSCIEKLQDSYDSMISDCNNSISDWNAKKAEAMQNKAKCSQPPPMKEVCD